MVPVFDPSWDSRVTTIAETVLHPQYIPVSLYRAKAPNLVIYREPLNMLKLQDRLWRQDWRTAKPIVGELLW